MLVWIYSAPGRFVLRAAADTAQPARAVLQRLATPGPGLWQVVIGDRQTTADQPGFDAGMRLAAHLLDPGKVPPAPPWSPDPPPAPPTGRAAARSPAQAYRARTGPQGELVTIQGVTRTAREWRRLLGVAARTYQQRKYRDGLTPEQALLAGAGPVIESPHRAKVTLHGVSLPMAAWARLVGVTPRTLEERIATQGLPRREALTRSAPTLRPGGRRASQVTMRGVTQSERAWCRQLGLRWGTYRARRRAGKSALSALRAPVQAKFSPRRVGVQ